eukprot:31412-Pelagococcus_subviridis.AAC.12
MATSQDSFSASGKSPRCHLDARFFVRDKQRPRRAALTPRVRTTEAPRALRPASDASVRTHGAARGARAFARREREGQRARRPSPA